MTEHLSNMTHNEIMVMPDNELKDRVNNHELIQLVGIRKRKNDNDGNLLTEYELTELIKGGMITFNYIVSRLRAMPPSEYFKSNPIIYNNFITTFKPNL